MMRQGPVLSNLRLGLSLIFLALLLALTVGQRLNYAIAPMDEGLLLAYPDLILREFLPYRDFRSPYGPGSHYLLAGVYSLFGATLDVERYVGLLYQYLILCASYLLGSRVSWSVGLLSAIASLTSITLFPLPGAYSFFAAWVFALFALLAGVMNDDSVACPRSRAFLAGILTGAVYWIRTDFAVLTTVALFVASLPASTLRFRLYSVGLLVPLVSLAVFAVFIGPHLFFDSLVMDAIRVRSSRVLPIQFDSLLVVFIACIVANVFIAVVNLRNQKPTQTQRLSRAIALISMGCVPIVFQRADHWHTAYAGAGIAALTVVSIGAHLPVTSRVFRSAKAILALLVAAFLISSPSYLSSSMSNGTRISSGSRWVLVPDWAPMSHRNTGRAMGLQVLIDELNQVSKPGQRLFVGPRDLRFPMYNDTYLYYLLPHLIPATRHLEMDPGVSNREGSGLAQDVGSADWLILSSAYEHWREPNASVIPGDPSPNMVISSRFCALAEHGYWVLMKRCSES